MKSYSITGYDQYDNRFTKKVKAGSVSIGTNGELIFYKGIYGDTTINPIIIASMKSWDEFSEDDDIMKAE